MLFSRLPLKTLLKPLSPVVRFVAACSGARAWDGIYGGIPGRFANGRGRGVGGGDLGSAGPDASSPGGIRSEQPQQTGQAIATTEFQSQLEKEEIDQVIHSYQQHQYGRVESPFQPA